MSRNNSNWSVTARAGGQSCIGLSDFFRTSTFGFRTSRVLAKKVRTDPDADVTDRYE